MMSFKKSVSILALFAVLLSCIQVKTHLVVAASPSLPWKIYLVVKGSPWKKGDIVTLKGHPSFYIEGDPFLTKRVVGVAGDRIVLEQGKLGVESKVIGSLLSCNSRGQPLHALRAQNIPEGYVFVAGDDPRSFDSRYQEFGLVRVEHIVGRTFPLW